MLRAGEVDVLVTNAPVDEPDLVAGPVVLTEPVVLAVATGHPLAPRTEVTLDDLGGEVVLRAGRRGPPYWQDPDTWTTADGTPIRHGPTVDTLQELLALVAAGEAVCPLAGHAVAYFTRPTLAFVPFTADAPPVRWGLTWRTTGRTERVRAFARAAAEAVAVRREAYGSRR